MSIRKSNTSITHTFGNVACVALDYIKSFFSEDFFNTVHISTKVAYRQLDVFRSKREFWKLQKPMLIMRPRIELDDSSKWFYGSTEANRVHNAYYGVEFGSLIPLLIDKQHGVNVSFLWNRLKIQYDVAIILETANMQMNIAHALHNMIVPNAPFMIETSLESFIPKNIVYSACNQVGISSKDTARVLEYMNSLSKTPITYKFKNGSGNNEFFALYPTGVETIVSDISMDDGNNRGLAQDNYTISFTMSCEFNCMATFCCILRDDNDSIITDPIDNTDYLENKGTTIPIFTIPILSNFPVKPGWRIASSPMFTVEPKYINGITVDETDISSIITPSIQKIINHQKGMNLPLGLFMEFKLYANKEELIPDKDYTIDLDKYIIRTTKCIPSATYRLFLLVNNAYIHATSSEITKFNQEL